MLKFKLPNELKNEYNLITKKFSKIQNNWKKYNDQIIPEDPEFAKEIINFKIKVIDYILDNYENTDVPKYQDFLWSFDYEFLYGPHHDDRNYLDFDERLDDEERMSEYCLELMDEEYKLTKNKLKKIRSKYSQLLLKF